MAATAKAFRVYYAKVEEGEGDDYTMDHTANIYLMGPDGKFRVYFPGSTTTPETMAEGILDVL